MQGTLNNLLRGSLVLALCLAFSLAAHAGSKMKLKGDVEEVSQQVEKALTDLEMEIDLDQTRVEKSWAKAVARTESGTRMTISVNALSEDECEMSVDSDSPHDPEIEKKFLSIMRSR